MHFFNKIWNSLQIFFTKSNFTFINFEKILIVYKIIFVKIKFIGNILHKINLM